VAALARPVSKAGVPTTPVAAAVATDPRKLLRENIVMAFVPSLRCRKGGATQRRKTNSCCAANSETRNWRGCPGRDGGGFGPGGDVRGANGDAALHSLRAAQQVEDRASAVDRIRQRGDVCFARRRRNGDRVAKIVRVDRRQFVAGRPRSGIDFADDLDLDRVDRNVVQGGLYQERMIEAGAQDTELQLRRRRTEVVAGEIGRRVRDDLVIANADPADAAAPLGSHRRGERRRRQ